MDADLLALRIKVTGGKAGAGEVKLVRDEAGRLRDEQGRYVKEQTQQTRQQEENVKRQTRVTSAAFKKQAMMMQSTGRSMTYGVTLPLAAIGVVAVKTAVDFTKSMAQVQVATGLPESRMGSLRDLALEMGAKTIFSANESAEAMLELAKSGISPAKIEAGALASTMQLAATEGLALGRTAEIVGAAMNTFRIPANESARIADALAGGANASSASVGGLAESLTQGGQAAATYGVSLEETVGTLAAFAQNGMQASDAGTSFKTFMARLNPTQKKQRELMNELNISFFDQQGRFVGLTKTAAILRGALGGLSQEQRGQALQTLFGSDASRAANIVYKEGALGLDKYIRATEKKGAAEKMANAQMEGLPGAIERAKGSLETAALVLGEALAPAIMTVASKVEWLANEFTGLPDSVQTTIAVVGALAALAGPMIWFTGSIAGAIIKIRELRTAEAMGGGMLGGMTKGRLAAGVGGVAAMTAGQAVGGTAGAALGNIGGGAAMGFAVGGPWGAAIGGGLGAAATFAPAIMDLFKAKPSKMAQEVSHLSDAMGSYKSAANGLDRIEHRAAKAKHQHTLATQAEKRASHHLIEVLAHYGPYSGRATKAQKRLSEAQRDVTRTAKAEQRAQHLSGFRLKEYRIQTLHAVASIKQLIPGQKHRIRAMREEVNHGRTGIQFLNELEKLEGRVGKEKQKLTSIYAESEAKAGKPWAKHLQKLTTLQARYGEKGKTLVGVMGDQRTKLESLKTQGLEATDMYREQNRALEKNLRLYEQINEMGDFAPAPLHPGRRGRGAAGHNTGTSLPRDSKVTPAPATRRLLSPVGDPQTSARAAAFRASDGGRTVLAPIVVKVGRKEILNIFAEGREDAEARL